MSQDVAKLAIIVGTKGVKESDKEIRRLSDSINNLVKDTVKKTKVEKTATAQTEKFTTTMGTFRSTLPQVASGLYLVQQAYSTLNNAITTVEEAYKAQYSSEVKLQTILQTTNHAIGMTAEQVYSLNEAWAEATGINDALLNEVAAIGATFTQLSNGIFPRLMEQALNMSTIFGQDLKQSMVQLGIATNNLQYGRLTRVGITFTEQQKDQITAHREAGEVLEGQILIMDELEAEIGQVAKAMGETSLGAIDKYKTAWVDLYEELGEMTTNFKAELLEATGITDLIKKMSSGLADINAGKSIEKMFEKGILTEPLVLANTRLSDLENSLERYSKKLQGFSVIQEKQRTDDNPLNLLPPEVLQENILYYDNLVKAVEEAITAKKELEQQTLDELSGRGPKGSIAGDDALSDADKWLMKMREIIAVESDRTKVNSESTRIQKLTNKYRTELNKLTREGFETELTQVEVDKEIEELKSIYLMLLKEEKVIEAEITAEKEAQQKYKDIKAYGSEENQAIAERVALEKELTRALAAKNITEGEAQAARDDLRYGEEVKVTSIQDYFDAYIEGSRVAFDEVQILEDAMKSLTNTITGAGIDLATEAFANLGASMVNAKEANKDWGQFIEELIASTLLAVGPQLLLAGATRLAATGGVDPVGWALLAAGAATTIGGGAYSQVLADKDKEKEEVDPSYSSALSGTTTDLSGSANKVTTNIINNGSPVTAETTASRGAGGETVLDVVLTASTASVQSNFKVQRTTVPVV
jgi:chromosome segregation ATPase